MPLLCWMGPFIIRLARCCGFAGLSVDSPNILSETAQNLIGVLVLNQTQSWKLKLDDILPIRIEVASRRFVVQKLK